MESDKDPHQYVGQSGATETTRMLQHVNDIVNGSVDKAVPKHFQDTGSTSGNLIVTPIKVVRSENAWVRLHFQREFLNRHGLIEIGINRNL